MQLRTEMIDGVRVVRPLTLVIDASNSAELGARLPYELSGTRQMIVDLCCVREIDGDGLAAILDCWRAARDRRVRLVLCGLSPRARLVARLLDVESVVVIAEDLDDALSIFGVTRPAPTERIA